MEKTIKLFLKLYDKLDLYINYTKLAIRCGMRRHSYRVISRVANGEPVKKSSMKNLYDIIKKCCETDDPEKELLKIHEDIPHKISIDKLFSCKFCKRKDGCNKVFPTCVISRGYESVIYPPLVSLLITTSRFHTERTWR